ncbi:SCP-2 sterol transfer family protein [Mycolicibacterium sp. 018/SC-01/001]|uniref:SCP-2 sterol transfer family protein n=1 Tax=Mycolicibacterium sp. 018/SC-01/001 TaxID=2592069 RepID=UPI00117E1B94|nr:SCP-2 sterol transfer family protein [Mycolicibacterium sp. 018/SC-01/001]TRW84750.1 SCP-2 sterol transfer family protein [Mycolicibacterium sp. 018/SC-01/001]
MAEPVSSLLRRSIDHLATEVPASHRAVVDALGPLVVLLAVDDERFSLSGGGDELTVGEETSAHVHIRTTRTTILEVVDANVLLADAIEQGAVDVLGDVDDVVRAHDTLVAFVHAAVRDPGQAHLLDGLRAGS